MERFLWVCFAGALGTGARYLVGSWALTRFGHAFPFGTLIVNLVGVSDGARGRARAARQPGVGGSARDSTTGFLGGLTTYSASIKRPRAWCAMGPPCSLGQRRRDGARLLPRRLARDVARGARDQLTPATRA